MSGLFALRFISADSLAIDARSRDVQEGNTKPAVDEGRGAHAQDAHGCEDKDGDCAKAEAERRCDVSSGVEVGRDVGTEVDPVGDSAQSPGG
jgi:hypothetical protein